MGWKAARYTKNRMPIYYALVGKASGCVVLTDFTTYVGNFHSITQKLMPRIEANTMKTFELDEFFFHYINEDGIVVLCMTDKAYKRKQAFAFLGDVKKSLLKRYNHMELNNAGAHSINTFAETIREKIVSIAILTVSHFVVFPVGLLRQQ